jgi:arylsulfatase
MWPDAGITPFRGAEHTNWEGVAVAQFVQTMKTFPPRRRPASFTVDQILESLYRQ